MKERNVQIDNIRGLLMLLVVFGHALEVFRSQSKIAEFVYTFIYLFHMPVFIFISGYLSKNKEKGQQSATRSYLVPYLLLNTIWHLVALLTRYITGNEAIGAQNLEFSFFTPGWALWYILALFVWKMLLPDLAKLKKPIFILVVMGVFSRFFGEIDTFMSISRIIVFAPFFMAGYLTQAEDLESFKQWRFITIVLTISVVVIFSMNYVFNLNIPSEFLWGDRAYANFDLSVLQCMILAISIYAIGFLSIPVFFNLISTRNSLMTQVGQNTLPVYVFHPYIIAPASFLLVDLLNHEYVILGALMLLALITCFILSRPNINRLLNKGLKRFDHFIFKGES